MQTFAGGLMGITLVCRGHLPIEGPVWAASTVVSWKELSRPGELLVGVLGILTADACVC